MICEQGKKYYTAEEILRICNDEIGIKMSMDDVDKYVKTGLLKSERIRIGTGWDNYYSLPKGEL